MLKKILIIIPLGLIISRQPALITHPRMWAEEATVHLQNSYSMNLWEMFLYIPENIGYLCLNINISTIVIRVFPIEYAAFISTVFGFVFQAIIHFIIIGSKNKIWGSMTRRLTTSTALVIIPVGTGETWLNTTCAHYHFAVLSVIILLDYSIHVSKTKNIIYSILLILAALSSPVGCFMIIAFYYAKFISKFCISCTCLLCYSIACLIQTAISFTNIYTLDYGLSAGRFEDFQILELPSVLLNDVIIKSSLGESFLILTIQIISKISNITNISSLTLYHFVFYIILLILIFFRKKMFSEDFKKVLLVAFFTTFLLIFLSVSTGTTLLGRNALLSGSIFLLLICLSIDLNLKHIKLLIIIFLSNNFYCYYTESDLYYSKKWTTWKTELQYWRNNPDHNIRVWPRQNTHWHFLAENDWRISLPNE